MSKIIRNIYYKLSVQQRYTLRRIIYYPFDLFRKRNVLKPPKGMIYTGGGDFIKLGNAFFNYFKINGNITPDSNVLDIGSGIGRIAIPFTNYLSDEAIYRGFDVVKSGVDWCNKNISKKHSNFKFKHVALKNELYNMETNEQAKDFVFPYQNDEFDFVFLTSVFTHMLPNDIENYLKEISRVLRKDRLCILTVFILDNVSKRLMNSAEKNFKYKMENYSLMNEKVKTANVAYDKSYFFNLLKENKFSIEKYEEGSWSGRENTINNFTTQDILILKNVK